MHTSPYLSPTSLIIPSAATGNNSLEGFPPTYVVYGGAERLARSIGFFWSRLQLARTAELISGKRPVVEDRLIEGPDAVHDFMIFPWQSEDAAVVYEGLDVWLRDLLVAEGQPTEEEAASPDWKDSRKSLKTGKSPRMGPTKDRRGVLSMFGDMGDEGRRWVISLTQHSSSFRPA
jgi:hypothetical protein